MVHVVFFFGEVSAGFRWFRSVAKIKDFVGP